MRPHGLSKTKLLSSLQCQKRLWLEIRRPEAGQVSPATQAAFDVGHNVGNVARRLLPDGILIEWTEDLQTALAQTTERLKTLPTTLFEGAFQHDGVLVRADIVLASRHGLVVKEVKAATSVKECHLQDASIQSWVMTKAGYEVQSIAIQHINNQFVYRGDEDYGGLFAEKDVTRHIGSLVDLVPTWISRARGTLDGEEPAIRTGKQCSQPYECAFRAYCEAQEPQTKYPVSILPYGGKTVHALIGEGYRDVRDIPAGRLTSSNHERVRKATVDGVPDFDFAAAKVAMARIGYPRYYLDFETTTFAVPLWANTRPYQALPFQYSCHIERSDGSEEWRGFLDLTGEPPMERLLHSVLETLGTEGPILAWNAGFEMDRLRELAKMYSAAAPRVEAVLKRFVDLLAIVRSYYYHADMMGSWSLKAVLPTIDPTMDYAKLGEIKEGGGAQAAYLESLSPNTGAVRRRALESALIIYCRFDTKALVRIARFLQTGK